MDNFNASTFVLYNLTL